MSCLDLHDGATCSHCGNPARVRLSMETLDGMQFWEWFSCGCQGDKLTVPLRYLLRVHVDGRPSDV